MGLIQGDVKQGGRGAGGRGQPAGGTNKVWKVRKVSCFRFLVSGFCRPRLERSDIKREGSGSGLESLKVEKFQVSRFWFLVVLPINYPLSRIPSSSTRSRRFRATPRDVRVGHRRVAGTVCGGRRSL